MKHLISYYLYTSARFDSIPIKLLTAKINVQAGTFYFFTTNYCRSNINFLTL